MTQAWFHLNFRLTQNILGRIVPKLACSFCFGFLVDLPRFFHGFPMFWAGLKPGSPRFPDPGCAFAKLCTSQVQYVTCKRLRSADLEARAKAWQVGLKTGGSASWGQHHFLSKVWQIMGKFHWPSTSWIEGGFFYIISGLRHRNHPNYSTCNC